MRRSTRPPASNSVELPRMPATSSRSAAFCRRARSKRSVRAVRRAICNGCRARSTGLGPSADLFAITMTASKLSRAGANHRQELAQRRVLLPRMQKVLGLTADTAIKMAGQPWPSPPSPPAPVPPQGHTEGNHSSLFVCTHHLGLGRTCRGSPPGSRLGRLASLAAARSSPSQRCRFRGSGAVPSRAVPALLASSAGAAAAADADPGSDTAMPGSLLSRRRSCAAAVGTMPTRSSCFTTTAQHTLACHAQHFKNSQCTQACHWSQSSFCAARCSRILEVNQTQSPDAHTVASVMHASYAPSQLTFCTWRALGRGTPAGALQSASLRAVTACRHHSFRPLPPPPCASHLRAALLAVAADAVLRPVCGWHCRSATERRVLASAVYITQQLCITQQLRIHSAVVLWR